MLSFSLATAVLALSTAVAGAVVQKRGCTGYVPASDVFSLGQSQQYIQDVNASVAEPGTWDYGTTKIFYEDTCREGVTEIREISFVTLDDCKPVTASFTWLSDIDADKSQVWSFNGTAAPVKLDDNGAGRFKCSPFEKGLGTLRYEAHFDGYHREELLENLGFADKAVAA